ncbi:MAG: Gldg family protein [Oscillospiraceae bacterium]|nr:Gldg family protein [Oscillospiraceae bacterium]
MKIKKFFDSLGTKSFKLGSYSFILTAIVLAIVIAVNLLANSLPDRIMHYDISAAKIFTFTSNTKAIVTRLNEDVTINWIVQAGKEDEIVGTLLDKYTKLSDHVKVVKKNPDIYPGFASQYTSETIYNNDLIVTCGDRSRLVRIRDIYMVDTSESIKGGNENVNFDGEGQITSAINYVTRDELPLILNLIGHEELDFTQCLTASLTKANYDIANLSLINKDEVPEEAKMVLINSPQVDINQQELEILEQYILNGGRVMLISGLPIVEKLDNIYELIRRFGFEKQPGVVVEPNSARYAYGQPYSILATMNKGDITDPLIEENRQVIVPISQGMVLREEMPDKYLITELLTTEDTTYSKLKGINLDVFDREDGDIDGPFCLSALIEMRDTKGMLCVLSSDFFCDDDFNSNSAGSNMDYVINAINYLIGDNEYITIRATTVKTETLQISQYEGKILKIVMLGVIPVAFLLSGLIQYLRRRGRK